MGTTTTVGTMIPTLAFPGIFNGTYYQSKHPDFDPLFNGRPGSRNPSGTELAGEARWELIGKLIAAGHIVDEEIDAEGMEPYTVMFMRQLYGQTWEPNGLGEVKVTGVNQPGAVVTPGMFTGPVPAGAIKVSTMLEDYPPYPMPASGSAPPPPPIPHAANPIGIRIIPQVPSKPNFVGDVFRCATANDGYDVGDTWTGTSGAFTGEWTKQALLGGMMIVWTKTA